MEHINVLINNKVSLAIKDAMKTRSWTQHDLSAASGVSQGTISLIINGKISPKFETIAALARALGLSLDDLLEDTAEDEQPHQLAAC